MSTEKRNWLKLSKKSIIFLYCYFTLIIFISLFFLINFQLQEINFLKKYSIYSQSIIGSVISSLLGSSIFYIRKLYKACIGADVTSPENKEERLKMIGVFFYFFLRPIFSVSFAWLSILLIKSGVSFISKFEALKEEFIYTSVVVGFLIGYSSGNFIDRMEILSEKFLNKIIVPK